MPAPAAFWQIVRHLAGKAGGLLGFLFVALLALWLVLSLLVWLAPGLWYFG